MLKFLTNKVFDCIDFGMTPWEAVEQVAHTYGIYKGGNIYNYLLKRAKEHRWG